jgi:hypothetical protein
LFQDDFTDPSSGWDRVRDENGITDYEGGAYRIQIRKPNWYFWSTPGLMFRDVSVEVDALRREEVEIDQFGLICRSQNAENFYFFTVTSDGFFGIGKFRDGVESLIGMSTLQSSEAIEQGSGPNHLRGDCVGDTLTFSVNGVLLAEARDSAFPAGDVGLIVGTFEEGGSDLRFDNFSVVAP